jgi:hypothetical protein
MAVRINVLGACLLYAALLGLALLWGGLRGDVNVFVLPREAGTPPPGLVGSVALGVGLGVVAVLASRGISRFEWARRLNAEFRRLLGPLTLGQVTVLAITSAVAEEAFFRGAMQPALGYPATSIIFGLLHLGPGRVYWPWTFSALAAGFAFGGITLYTGDILAATLAHFTVNYFNLWHLSTGSLGGGE